MSRIHRTDEELNAITNGTALEAIAAERAAQDRHWGYAATAEHSWAEWMLILHRELGEADVEAARLTWDGNAADTLQALRTELIQVAAVAVAITDRINFLLAEGW